MENDRLSNATLETMREIVNVLRNMDSRIEKIWEQWELERSQPGGCCAEQLTGDDFDEADEEISPEDRAAAEKYWADMADEEWEKA